MARTFARPLVLSVHWVGRVAPALQEVAGERTTEVLPALQNVSFRAATAIWTCQGRDSEVHCCASALGLPRGALLVMRVMRGLVVNV